EPVWAASGWARRLGAASSAGGEANIIAKDSLVSRQYWRTAWNARANKKQLLDICAKAEVHPSIMAGMIRHQAKNYKLYPELHHSMDVKSAFGFAND
ncbi:hypothetical protein AAIH29_30940, partial [Pseudomonas aeruginosa]